MCMTIASQSVSAWLQSQERMLRVWRDELLLSGADDQNQIERIDGHRRWLVEEMALLEGKAEPAA
jgi:antibiotic biosynthesis monooxygenase (ABM) superfamily enzyme